MESKKNPKKDLNRNSGMYFVLGLFMVLTLTYIALEWKSFYETPDYETSMNEQDDLFEKVDLVKWKTPPPPKPPVTPPVIEIIPDDDETIETIIESIEPDQDTEVIEYNDIEFDEGPEEDVSVLFKLVEEVPIFPGCENESDKRACFNQKIKKHIIKNFKYPELEQEMGIQGRVNVMFEIQKDGSIGNIRMRGPNKNLENDAARIIGKLPKMTPGKQRGTAVKVPFSIPITYTLQN